MKRVLFFMILLCLVFITPLVRAQEARKGVIAGAGPSLRTIEFESSQVTQADVTLSPDDKWLVFTMLGHLFRLPAAGGAAEQLTFGPYYDSDAVFSPDGKRVAFVSDREDSDRNIFVLELANRQITQVTREPWADRPIWSPDGQAIVYLSLVGGPQRFLIPPLPSMPAYVRRVRLAGGEAETVSSPRRLVTSVFYLPDGRLAWTMIEFQDPASERATTRIEVLSSEGTVSRLRMLDASADHVVASPKGDGIYCRCSVSPETLVSPTSENFLFLPLPQGVDRQVAPLSRTSWLVTLWHYREPFRFALASDGKSLYVGEAGRIWRIATATGLREAVPFTARVKLEIHAPVAPRKQSFVAAGSSAPPRVIQEPRVSPDGQSLVFGAAGYLWQQPLNGGPARRLFEGNAFERDPAFSPDGRQLAFRSGRRKEEVRVFNFESRQTTTLASGDNYGLSWSPDGQRLVFTEERGSVDQAVAVTLRDGKKEKLIDDADWYGPHFSADGQWLYLTGGPKNGLYRMRVAERAKPEPITRLDRQFRNGLVSPNGKWLVFRRNSEIWVAPLSSEQVEEKDVRLLSAEGAEGYSFTPDGSSVIYAIGNRVWRHPLAAGAREEIPIRLELQRPIPPPVLVRRVRVLDYAAGGFRQESSLYIEQGRIRWIGSERGRTLSPNTVIVDAGGRFAIPGLFDMHTHIFDAGTGTEPEAFIAYGVTSVRDVGVGSLRLISALADHLESSPEPGPRLFYTGDTFRFQALSNVGPMVAIRDEEDARNYVRRWKEQGAHFIKAYSWLSWRLRRAVAEEARRQGLPVIGHGMSVEEITKSVTFGFASLEHFDRYTRAYDDIHQMLAGAGTLWVPTLEAPWGNVLLLRTEPERLADPKLRAFIPESSIRIDNTISNSMLRGLWVDWLAGIQPAHRRGVRLQTGSDASSGVPFPGVSLHWELEHFVEAGLTPLEVLRIATQQAAEAVGARDDLGTLEAGKLADIVLLDKNPLEDIKNTQTIWRVFKGGWVFDPEKLRPPAPVSTPK